MFKTSLAMIPPILVLIGLTPALAQHKPEVIERGKKATALVEVNTAKGGATGSAFCIDKSGLFITNSHVVADASEPEGGVRLVIDIGLKTQRSMRAKILRADDILDLALLKIDASSGLTALEMGKDNALRETDPVITFGFPLGHSTTVRAEAYPDITVLTGRITSLRRDKDRLEGVQFDGQLNPGNSGGPVVDEFGRVIGVAVATVRGAAMNLAIPVGRLAEFLTAPGLIFDPPPLFYKDRSLPVTWTIKVQPGRPDGKLPEKLSVSVTVADGIGDPRSVAAQSIGNGVFKVKVTPVPREPDQKVDLDVRFPNGQAAQVQVKDAAVMVGNAKFLLSDLEILFGGPSPRAHPRRGPPAFGPILGLGKVKTKSGKKTITIDLNEASQIAVRPLSPPAPVQAIAVQVEAKQGSNVLATVVKQAELGGAPLPRAVVVRVGPDILIVPVRPAGPPVSVARARTPDDGLRKIGDLLNVDGVPRGAGKSIHPPDVAMGEAMGSDAGCALTRKIDGKISDIAVGGGARYLVLSTKDSRELAIFDVNAGDVIKTMLFTSGNTIVTAGANAILIGFPDEGVLQRWNLGTFTREGSNLPSPIDGRLMGLAMGNDSDGPLLAVWSKEAESNPKRQTRVSFLDAKTLHVLKEMPGPTAGPTLPGAVSASGGSFLLNNLFRQRIHARASAGGDLFALWHTDSPPSDFLTLAVHKATVRSTYNRLALDHLAPAPDGRAVYTGRGGVLSVEGKPLRGTSDSQPGGSSALAIPSPDAVYFLGVEGLNGIRLPDRPTGKLPVIATIYSAQDGARVLTLPEFEEMAIAGHNESFIPHDLTAEKRFHFVPAANLLVTIPFTDDRLVLRRLDMGKALDQLGGDYFVITTPPILYVRAGKNIVHQIEGRSRAGGLRYTLTRGPSGLTVSSTGKLTWLASRNLAGGDAVTAVVTVADASGKERFHKLTIQVN